MTTLTVAAVRSGYVLMDREANLDRVEALTADAVSQGAQIVVFPEAFVPGIPIWIDTRRARSGRRRSHSATTRHAECLNVLGVAGGGDVRARRGWCAVRSRSFHRAAR